MTQLSTKIKKYVNSEVDFTKDVLLQDDGQGVYIKEWNLDIAKPTQAQLDSLETEAQAEENLQSILNARATAYPSIQEQLDMQYWDKVNGTTNWEDAIAKVKLDNPKP
ncbi:hypothetical protein HTVC131P_gp47 [Pelagibacter phage HTVC131P]|nr:hypothetical protein HTVC131P_gp47 [Pelagibacter phage HTVC131P]